MTYIYIDEYGTVDTSERPPNETDKLRMESGVLTVLTTRGEVHELMADSTVKNILEHQFYTITGEPD